MFSIVASATMLCWSYTIQTNGINCLLPRSRHRQNGSLHRRQSDAWTQISSWMSIPGERLGDVCTCLNGRVEGIWMGICHGCQQSYPGLDTKAEVPAIQLVGFKTTRDEIWELYNNVYQLKRSPGPLTYGLEQTKEWVQEILTSLKEWLWQRWGSTQQKEEPEWGLTSTLRMWVGGNDLCNSALAEAREAHWQVLEAAHILEEKIEWLSQSATRIGSTSHWHSHSCGHLRRQPRGCSRGHTKAPTGEDHARAQLAISHQENQRGRCFPSSTPSRRWVTFQDQQGESLSEEDSSGEHMG